MSELYPPTAPAPSSGTVQTDCTAATAALTTAVTAIDAAIADAVSGVAATAKGPIATIESHFGRIESALLTLRAIARQARRISLGQPAHGAI
jgi:hypothetical protein